MCVRACSRTSRLVRLGFSCPGCRSAAEREEEPRLWEERRGSGRGLGSSARAQVMALRVASGRLAPWLARRAQMGRGLGRKHP